MTESNKLLMQWRGPTLWRVVWGLTVQSKDGVQDKDMPREYVEEVYFAREPEVDAVLTSIKDDAIVAVAGMIHQNTDPEPEEVPDL